MSSTVQNLKNAFAGESQANRRYLAFAKKADKEGLPQVARLFRAAAEAETIHALNHLGLIGEIKSTAENLQTALSGETFEFTKMYPEYLNTAKQEGNSKVIWTFDYANKVEQIHGGLFSKTLETLKTNKPLPATDYYVCSVCGNTVENEPPEKCPICGASRISFSKVT